MIYTSSIKLEKDSLDSNIYYIQFKYTSLISFSVNIYLNAAINTNIETSKK